jgi:hypothetical protein
MKYENRIEDIKNAPGYENELPMTKALELFWLHLFQFVLNIAFALPHIL